jgi:hypothetical protein
LGRVPVQFVPVKVYPAAVMAFLNNQVQLAWLGGLSGGQARLALPGSVALARGEEGKAFISSFISHQSTGLSESVAFPLGASGGRSFTFGAKTSTSEVSVRRDRHVRGAHIYTDPCPSRASSRGPGRMLTKRTTMQPKRPSV